MNGTRGSFVPFIIMTEVPCPTGLHLEFSGVGIFAATAATARNREGASRARRNASRKHAAPIDTDFTDELIDQRNQELHIVDVDAVRAEVTHFAAVVPI